MKIKTYFISTLFAVIAVSCSMADEEMDRLKALHGKMDTGKDGIVSNQEFLLFWQVRFERRDKDKDGFLDASEADASSIKGVDTNYDGLASLKEELKLRQGFFESMDQNANQLLTVSEIQRKAAPEAAPKVAAQSQGPVNTGGFVAQRAAVEALSGLTAAPAMWLADNFDSTDDLAAIYFDALDWKGQPTKVFAWLGLPEQREGKVPGVVLVHGGGGTASRDWVNLWKKRGYAAISIAVEGQTDEKSDGGWQSHEWAGPKRLGIYADSSQPLADQWMYHAVAGTILANSLLCSLPEVDAEQVGLMGISWGGVVASTVIGIDNRFAFAIPAYGCGNLSLARNQYGRALATNETYKQVWDPILRLQQAQMPTLWYSWPSDAHFPLDLQASCYAAQPSGQMVSLVPNMGHGHGPAWSRSEGYAFADSVLKEGSPWCVQRSAKRQGDTYEVVFRSTKPLDSAVLVSTTDDGVTGSRKWVQTPLSKPTANGGLEWKARAQIPKGSTAWFINVMSGELIVSSHFTEVN